jgi:hypothetical protein
MANPTVSEIENIFQELIAKGWQRLRRWRRLRRPGLRIWARIEKSAPRQKEEHPSGDKFGGGEAHVLTRTECLFYSKNKTEKARALPPSEQNTLIHPLQRFQSGILY